VATADRAVRVDPVTLYGTASALAVVALVLVLQVSLGFLMGTLLRRPLPAIVALLFLWYPVNLVLHTFKLEALSPISLSQALPALLRESRPEDDSPSAESAKDREMEELSRQTAKVWSFLSGSPPPAPARPPGFFERDEFRDFSLGRVLLGYGLPTLAAIGLATLCFCRRDL
jgi:hypothetical protein